MKNTFLYNILKVYGRFLWFAKKHKGNAQMLAFSDSTTFKIFIVYGQMEDGPWVLQQMEDGPVNFMSFTLDSIKQQYGKNFIQLQKNPCKVKQDSSGNIVLNMASPGKHFPSKKYSLTYSHEYSNQNVIIYFMDGEVNLQVKDTTKVNPKNIKMVATRNIAVYQSMMKNIKK